MYSCIAHSSTLLYIECLNQNRLLLSYIFSRLNASEQFKAKDLEIPHVCHPVRPDGRTDR